MRHARWGLIAILTVALLSVLAGPASAGTRQDQVTVQVTAVRDLDDYPAVLFTVRLHNTTGRSLRNVRLESSQFWDAQASGTGGVWTPALKCGPSAGTLLCSLADLAPHERRVYRVKLDPPGNLPWTWTVSVGQHRYRVSNTERVLIAKELPMTGLPVFVIVTVGLLLLLLGSTATWFGAAHLRRRLEGPDIHRTR